MTEKTSGLMSAGPPDSRERMESDAERIRHGMARGLKRVLEARHPQLAVTVTVPPFNDKLRRQLGIPVEDEGR